MMRFITTLAALALTTSVALAQKAPVQHSDSTGKAGTKSTEMPTGATGNKNDVASSNFIQKVAMSDQFEIESSKLALQKATDPQIKQFAQQMIDEHSKSSDKLKATLQSAGANMSPPAGVTFDAKHQSLMDKLRKASGKDFDRLYVQIQRDGHKEAVDLFRKYSKEGQETSLKGFAEETLPVIEKHLQHVEGLKLS
jgi:putative membrane protein